MNKENNENVFNLTKWLAEEELSFVMQKMDISETKENRDDVLALALNYLPAKYVTTDEGRQYAKLAEVYRNQYKSDVISALTKACMKVKEKPRTSSDRRERK